MNFLLKSLAALSVASAAVLPLSTTADAHDMKKEMRDGVMVSGAWARATAPTAKNGAAYMTITSHHGNDALIKVDGDVSDNIQLHIHEHVDGVMKMREVKSIAVAEGSPTVLQPGGLHVMLLGLKAPLKEGREFPLKLTFKSGATKNISVKVTGMKGPGGKMKHHDGEMHHHDASKSY